MNLGEFLWPRSALTRIRSRRILCGMRGTTGRGNKEMVVRVGRGENGRRRGVKAMGVVAVIAIAIAHSPVAFAGDTGACCLDDDTCVVATPKDCAALDGDYLGNGTTCEVNCPPFPPGCNASTIGVSVSFGTGRHAAGIWVRG